MQVKHKGPERLMGPIEGGLQSRREDPAISLGLGFSFLPTLVINIFVRLFISLRKELQLLWKVQSPPGARASKLGLLSEFPAW